MRQDAEIISPEERCKILPVGMRALGLAFAITPDGGRLSIIQKAEEPEEFKFYTTFDGSLIAAGILESGASFSLGPRNALHVLNPSVGTVASIYPR